MRSQYELVVKRAFQYLNLAECEISADTTRETLQIIDSELARGPDGVLARVLDRLEQRFDPLPGGVAASAPPLCRGSIGHT